MPPDRAGTTEDAEGRTGMRNPRPCRLPVLPVRPSPQSGFSRGRRNAERSAQSFRRSSGIGVAGQQRLAYRVGDHLLVPAVFFLVCWSRRGPSAGLWQGPGVLPARCPGVAPGRAAPGLARPVPGQLAWQSRSLAGVDLGHRWRRCLWLAVVAAAARAGFSRAAALSPPAGSGPGGQPACPAAGGRRQVPPLPGRRGAGRDEPPASRGTPACPGARLGPLAGYAAGRR